MAAGTSSERDRKQRKSIHFPAAITATIYTPRLAPNFELKVAESGVISRVLRSQSTKSESLQPVIDVALRN